MTDETKSELDTLISEGKVQHIYGVIGCCKNYYVQFPNETQKYTYNTNKPISGILSNKISIYVYTNATMQTSSSAAPAPAGRRLTTKTKPSETSYPAASSGPTGKRLSKKLTTLKQLIGKYTTNR